MGFSQDQTKDTIGLREDVNWHTFPDGVSLIKLADPYVSNLLLQCWDATFVLAGLLCYFSRLLVR